MRQRVRSTWSIPRAALAALLLTPSLLIGAVPTVGNPGTESSPSAGLLSAPTPSAGAPVPTDLESGAALFGPPTPTAMACSISRPCGDGNTVACTGSSSCVNSLRGVSCDGVETACPNYCSISLNCPGGVLTCVSLAGACSTTANGISCNGHEHVCRVR